MVDITLLEVHLEEGSFSAEASAPFSSIKKYIGDDEEDDDDSSADESRSEEAVGAQDDSDGGPGKKLGVIGVFVFLVLAGAVIRYLSGDDDEQPEVEIETPEDGPVGVTVDDEEK